MGNVAAWPSWLNDVVSKLDASSSEQGPGATHGPATITPTLRKRLRDLCIELHHCHRDRTALRAELRAMKARAEDGVELDDERLGRAVREELVKWAREQPDPEPGWLIAYDEMPEEAKEVDRRIGRRLADLGRASREAAPDHPLEATPEELLAAPCPTCGAAPGAYCEERPGKILLLHRQHEARFRAARQTREC